MPEMGKYVHVNSFGTAQMLEIIRDENLPVKKFVVASSQAVYREGAALCPTHGLVFPETRPKDQLAAGDFAVRCPECGLSSEPTTTPEEAPTGGETVYAITKADQEKLVLTWGRQTGIPAVALRYSCTYGPRQSIFNPYTGVIAIFCTRLLSGGAPVLYEDGEQTRDFSYVGDIARANLLAATTDKLDGMTANIGSGKGTSIREVAEMISSALDIPIEPVARGEFRPGEMRHLTPDVSRAASAGYAPEVELGRGHRTIHRMDKKPGRYTRLLRGGREGPPRKTDRPGDRRRRRRRNPVDGRNEAPGFQHSVPALRRPRSRSPDPGADPLRGT